MLYVCVCGEGGDFQGSKCSVVRERERERTSSIEGERERERERTPKFEVFASGGGEKARLKVVIFKRGREGDRQTDFQDLVLRRVSGLKLSLKESLRTQRLEA